MLRYGIAVAAMLAVVPASAESASGFTASGPAQTFSFDASDGRYQTLKLPVACPVNALRGTVHFTRLGTATTEWHPGLTVLVARGPEDGESGRKVALSIWAKNYTLPLSADLAMGRGRDTVLGTQTYAGTMGADGNASFLVTWTADGTVTATISDQTLTMQLDGEAEYLRLNGSTGAGDVAYELGQVPDANAPKCKLVASLGSGPIGNFP